MEETRCAVRIGSASIVPVPLSHNHNQTGKTRDRQDLGRHSDCPSSHHSYICSTACSPSYRHFYTGVLDPSPGVPAFTAVSYVHDQKILHYDSETRREEPRGDWVQGAVNPDFWERETRSLRGWQQGFEGNQVTLRHWYNQTDWSYTLQFMYGCELGEDNSTEGYMQFGYDGEDFISYDLRTHTWVAVPTQAQVTQSRWNGDKNLLLIVRAYLEGKCIEWLWKYLQHGKAALQSKSPMSQVSDRPSSWAGLTTLSCQVHGFYPKNISVVWLKNGEAQPQETSCSGVLPSGDGTYQTWATIEIDPNNNHNYTCCVEHVSLGADLRVAWDKSRQKPESSLNLALVITIVLVIIAAMSTAIYFLRKRGPGHRAETVEQSQLQHPLQSSAEPREARDNS
ncbi:major histocompatibility complex class I-related gene protein [Alligator mississippiensis]|uniref:major histocompatibility complex class I-related gene protein n=1 Tax=Alligator mississippiensis TaxID=8496 RepID=UPI0028777905|nr:major histocompatibility complex class I-related gene protein [Alligator mississippiensis]